MTKRPPSVRPGAWKELAFSLSLSLFLLLRREERREEEGESASSVPLLSVLG